MATIVSLPDQETATLPPITYLDREHGLKSRLLTQDHKRIGILYLVTHREGA
jgi:cytochrome c oxidase subunit 1